MDFLEKLTSIPYKLAAYIKNRIWIEGGFHRSSLSLGKSNTIISTGDWMSSTLKCEGIRNRIIVQNRLLHSTIRIIGNNNTIEFNTGGLISYSDILVRADNAYIQVGKNSDLLSVNIVCQGRGNSVSIGDDCLFSRNIEIWNSDTHTILNSAGDIINHSEPVKIGEHVWIGKHVKILKGVTIGNNAVIGMGSIVSKDIPANSINVGCPAKTIKEGINWSRELVDFEN